MKYSKEVREYIAEHVAGTTTRDLTRMVNERFGTDFTESKIKSYKCNHNLRSGTPCGLPKGAATKTFPAEVQKYILENYKGTGHHSMADQLNERFGTAYTASQIKGYYGNHDLNSGLTGRFEAGHIPANKGKHPPTVGRMAETQFKKGHKAQNELPIGTVVLRPGSGGYLFEKFGPGALDWKPHHQLVWERAHGPQPEGYMVIFLDGDKKNCSLDNLRLISRAENAQMNKRGLRSGDKDVTETGIMLAKVYNAMHEAKKGKKDESDKERAGDAGGDHRY